MDITFGGTGAIASDFISNLTTVPSKMAWACSASDFARSRSLVARILLADGGGDAGAHVQPKPGVVHAKKMNAEITVRGNRIYFPQLAERCKCVPAVWQELYLGKLSKPTVGSCVEIAACEPMRGGLWYHSVSRKEA